MTTTVHPVTDGVSIVLQQRWELEKGAEWARAWATEEGFRPDDPESPAAYLLFLAELEHGMDLDTTPIHFTVDGAREVIDRDRLPKPEELTGKDAEAYWAGVEYAQAHGTELERMLARGLLETMLSDIEGGEVLRGIAAA